MLGPNRQGFKQTGKGLHIDRRGLDGLNVADILKRFRDTVVPSRRYCQTETIIINAFMPNPLADTKL